MTRVLRLTLIAPDIVEAILDGAQRPDSAGTVATSISGPSRPSRPGSRIPAGRRWERWPGSAGRSSSDRIASADCPASRTRAPMAACDVWSRTCPAVGAVGSAAWLTAVAGHQNIRAFSAAQVSAVSSSGRRRSTPPSAIRSKLCPSSEHLAQNWSSN